MAFKKKVTVQDLIEMKENGASLLKEDKPLTVEGLHDVVSEMKKNSDRHIKAINKAVEKLADVLERSAGNSATDHKELASVIAEVVRPPPKPDYVFDVSRNARGQIESITARQTVH